MLVNYRIFISHSSVQKSFVAEVVKALGRDFVNVDLYNFEAGGELTEEIANHIEASTVFVLMLSDKALDSRWVIEEIKKIHERLINDDNLVFLPFIIDNTVSHDDERLKKKGLKWISKYLLTVENSPSLVARVIKRRLRQFIWNNEPAIKERETLFFGRDQDMNDLRLKLFGNLDNQKRCIIISGMAHVGRKRLIKEFLWRHIKDLHDAYDPIRIVMTESDGIDRFLQQLNEIIPVYSNTELLEIMKSQKDCLRSSVILLNKISDHQERVFVRDDKCIVLSNGRITNWFVELIRNRDLYPMIHLFIASKFTPVVSVERDFAEVIVRQIKGLDRQNIRALFNAYAKNKKISLNEEQANVFLSQLNGYPRQVYDVIDSIADSDFLTAKRHLPQIVSMFDSDLVNILNEVNKTPNAKNILVMLSLFDFVSFDLLAQVCPNDISQAISVFRDYSLYESFGSANQYIRISPVMGDYISRNRISLPLEYKQSLRKVTRKMLVEMDDSLTDLSFQLLNIKEILKNSKIKNKERYLIPSFVLKVIIEEYKNDNNETVIQLAEMLIKDNNRNTYDEITRSVHYWYCCALCRTKDIKFLTEVEYFKKSNYSYNFLRGFFERQKKNYVKAEEFYEKALEQSRHTSNGEYISKAEHELVIVKIELDDYSGALELAKNSYERERDNTFHIEAYFRCLVRTAHPDVVQLKDLIDRMERSFAIEKETIARTMNAEYAYYINHDFTKAVEILKDILLNEKAGIKKYAERALKNICNDNDADIMYKCILREVNDCK